MPPSQTKTQPGPWIPQLPQGSFADHNPPSSELDTCFGD